MRGEFIGYCKCSLPKCSHGSTGGGGFDTCLRSTSTARNKSASLSCCYCCVMSGSSADTPWRRASMACHDPSVADCRGKHEARRAGGRILAVRLGPGVLHHAVSGLDPLQACGHRRRRAARIRPGRQDTRLGAGSPRGRRDPRARPHGHNHGKTQEGEGRGPGGPRAEIHRVCDQQA